MPRYLLHFSGANVQFKAAEWKSLCQINGLSQHADAVSDTQSPLVVIEFKMASQLQLVLKRSVLLKSAYELLHVADSHQDMFAWLNKDPDIIKAFDVDTATWALRIRSVGKKRSCSYVDKLLKEYINLIQIDVAPVDLRNPTYEFSIIEEMTALEEVPCKVYLALIHKFSLKERRYIGNSTMDPELAFLQANMSCIKAGDLVIDPFCGTGGLMLSAAYFGGFVFGTEINYLVARAKGKSSRQGEGDLREGYHSILANFEQYGLERRFLSVVLADASRKSLWKNDAIFDAIITDPPYGVREKGRKLGVKKKKSSWIDRTTNDTKIMSYPEKEKYQLTSTYLDLMDFAAQYLRVGGHVSYWYPILRQSYTTDCLPVNECLQLVHNCEQILNTKCSRRLLVYEKVRNHNPHAPTTIKADSYETKTFRDVFLNA